VCEPCYFEATRVEQIWKDAMETGLNLIVEGFASVLKVLRCMDEIPMFSYLCRHFVGGCMHHKHGSLMWCEMNLGFVVDITDDGVW